MANPVTDTVRDVADGVKEFPSKNTAFSVLGVTAGIVFGVMVASAIVSATGLPNLSDKLPFLPKP